MSINTQKIEFLEQKFKNKLQEQIQQTKIIEKLIHASLYQSECKEIVLQLQKYEEEIGLMLNSLKQQSKQNIKNGKIINKYNQIANQIEYQKQLVRHNQFILMNLDQQEIVPSLEYKNQLKIIREEIMQDLSRQVGQHNYQIDELMRQNYQLKAKLKQTDFKINNFSHISSKQLKAKGVNSLQRQTITIKNNQPPIKIKPYCRKQYKATNFSSLHLVQSYKNIPNIFIEANQEYYSKYSLQQTKRSKLKTLNPELQQRYLTVKRSSPNHQSYKKMGNLQSTKSMGNLNIKETENFRMSRFNYHY